MKHLIISSFIFTLSISCAMSNLKQSGSDGYNDDESEEVASMEITSDSKSKRGRSRRADKPKPGEAKVARMMIYEARLRNRVAELDIAIAKTTQLVKQYKGYIEKQRVDKSPANAWYTLRIPVAHFDTVLKQLSNIGTLLSRNITARDITRQFSDLSQKLNNRRQLLKRLYQILQKTTKTKQKIRILNEIARLEKEIDSMAARQKFMARKAAFSTIHIQFTATKKLAVNKGSAIKWIRSLRPDKRTLWQKPDFTFTLPVGFIDNTEAFENRSQALFISPDGVKVRAASIKNNPEGNAYFYEQALLYERLRYPEKILSSQSAGNRFTLTTPQQVGYNKGWYTITLFVETDTLHLIEIYYPNESVFKKHKSGIEKATKSIIQKSIFKKIMEAIW